MALRDRHALPPQARRVHNPPFDHHDSSVDTLLTVELSSLILNQVAIAAEWRASSATRQQLGMRDTVHYLLPSSGRALLRMCTCFLLLFLVQHGVECTRDTH